MRASLAVASRPNKLNLRRAVCAILNIARGRPLKVTIDSSEPLTDTIRVIGALYNVTLTQADESTRVREHDRNVTASRGSARSNGKPAPSARKQSQRSPAHKSIPAAATATRRRSAAKAAAPAADPGDIRAWARTHGHSVNDRGPLPGTVRAAYAAAQNG